jgi:polysaccharide pyruvyl transferase WcaK-like protein
LGDAAIQEAAIANLRARRPDLRIIGVSLNPEDTVRRHGIDTAAYDVSAFRRLLTVAMNPSAGAWDRVKAALRWRLDKRWIAELRHLIYAYRVLRDVDVLLMSGGGQLDEYWGGPLEHPLALLKWSALARATGSKVAYLSVGVGSVKRRLTRVLLRWALRCANYRTYRDEGSRLLVQNAIGFRTGGDVVADIAFALPRDEPMRSVVSQQDDQVQTIAVGPIPFFDPRIWPEKDPACYHAYVHFIAELCIKLLESGHTVKFVVGEVHHDPPVIRDVTALVRDKVPEVARARLVAPLIEGVDDLVRELSSSDLVVSSRFHGVLLSLLFHKPVVALSYERKVAQLMRDLQLDQFSIELRTAEVEGTLDAIKRAAAARREIASALASRVEPMAGAVLRQFDFVANELIPVCTNESRS